MQNQLKDSLISSNASNGQAVKYSNFLHKGFFQNLHPNYLLVNLHDNSSYLLFQNNMLDDSELPPLLPSTTQNIHLCISQRII